MQVLGLLDLVVGIRCAMVEGARKRGLCLLVSWLLRTYLGAVREAV
jgi:hypothetical protein